MKINAQKTYEAIRGQYGSVLKFCKAHQFHPRTFYKAMVDDRVGKKTHPAPDTERILKTLRDERLLVECPDAVSNG